MKTLFLRRKLFFSIALSMVCYCLLIGGALAANFPDVPESAAYAEAVNVLADNGILNGDENGNFNPNNTVTRAEFSAIICRLLGVEEDAKVLTQSKFSDVSSSHWAKGYIAKAAELGIVNGNEDGTFKPEDKVTFEQAVKMLICAIGFEENAKEAGSYPDGYIKIAEKYGYLQGIDKAIGKAFTRSNVAVLLANYINEQGGDYE